MSRVFIFILPIVFIATLRVSEAQYTYTTNADSTVTLTGYNGGLTGDVTIPDTLVVNGINMPVTGIGYNAFNNMTMRSVTMGTNLTSIGIDAFFSCLSLRSVSFGPNTTNIGNLAFYFCSNLRSAVLPQGMTSIPNNVFMYCTALGSVSIPNTVTNIAPYAFNNCSSLASVIIPSNVVSIGQWAFASSGLGSLEFSSGLGTIGNNAFTSCANLTSITIPNSVVSIGSSAFAGCTSLHQAYFQGNAPSADSSVFNGESGTVFYLPSTTGWASTFGGWPTAGPYQPQPKILGSGNGLGVRSNGFGFTIFWATNTSVVVDASTNLQDWTPVVTNTLVSGTNAFSDSAYTNFSKRFYRVRSQ